jgi:hypothetical protein
MMADTRKSTAARRSAGNFASPTGRPGGYFGAGRRSVLISWYASIVPGGFVFGTLADWRPFGENALFHPLVMFFVIVGLGLLALRVLMARPVPEVISDRALAVGCVLGLFMFLAGNFVATRLLALG